jgi:hypothetical protein
MIVGCHSIIYSKDAEKDRDFIKKVFKFPYVDVGNGWLIFGLPPAEVAVHPSKRNNRQELYLLCDDIKKTIAPMKKLGIECAPVKEQSWGALTSIRLPGGGLLKMYQPFHASPKESRFKKAKRPASGTKNGPSVSVRRLKRDA